MLLFHKKYEIHLQCSGVEGTADHKRLLQLLSHSGDRDLNSDEEVPVGRNILMLTNILESRNYTCVAASDLGNIEVVTRVKVKGGSWLNLWSNPHL